MSKDYNEKRKRVRELSNGIAFLMKQRNITQTKIAKINELQERLQFNLKRLEEKGLDKKIETLEKVSKTLKE